MRRSRGAVCRPRAARRETRISPRRVLEYSSNPPIMTQKTPPTPRTTPSRAGIFLAAPLEHPSHATTGRRPRARAVAVPPARTTAWRHARGRARRGSGVDAGADSTRRRRARRDAMRCDASSRRGAARDDATHRSRVAVDARWRGVWLRGDSRARARGVSRHVVSASSSSSSSSSSITRRRCHVMR